jgi:hypothetical protein
VSRALLLALLGACSGDKDAVAPPPPDCSVTWDSFGEGFLKTWCTSCHSSDLPADLRYGAPVGVDFDTLLGARLWGDRLVARAVGEGATMPPAGAVPAEQQQKLADWVACGLPGTEVLPPPGCEAAVERAGDLVYDSEAPLCDLPTRLTGDLTVRAPLSADCLCEIGGSLVISGPTVDLPELRSVGGDLIVEAGAEAVRVPELRTVGGGLLVSSVPGLVELDLRHLESVSSDVLVTDVPLLLDLPLTRLRTVPGALRVSLAPSLLALDLSHLETVGLDLIVEDAGLEVLLGEGYALESVGGDMLLRRLPAWMGFYGFAYLQEVGGDLRLEEAGIDHLRGFTELDHVGGTLSVSHNPRLEQLDGFDTLLTVTGDLIIEDNPLLFGEDAFAFLREIEGELRVVDNPALYTLTGVGNADALGGLLLQGSPLLQTLPVFASLQEVRGDVRFVDLGLQALSFGPVLDRLDGALRLQALPALSSLSLGNQLTGLGGDLIVTEVGLDTLTTPSQWTSVGGSLQISDNPELQDVTALHVLQSVAGDVLVTGNPALPAAEAAALVQALESVGGTVTVSDNGP